MSDDNRNYNLNDDIPPEFPADNGPPKFTKTEDTESKPPEFMKKEKSDSIMNSMFGSLKKKKEPKESVPKGTGGKVPKNGLMLGGLIGLAILIGVAALMLFGGSSVTAKSLCSETAKNMGTVESYTSTVKMDLDSNVTVESQSIDFIMDSTYETDINLGPYKSHTVGNYVMTAGGQKESVDLEMYMEESGNTVTLYSMQNGYWLKDTSYSASVFDVELFDKIGNGNLDAKLAEDTITIDGKEAYRLDVVLNGSDLANCFTGETEPILGMDYSEIDWDSIYADSKIYIYKDSKLPARIDIEAGDIGDVFIRLMLESAFGTEVSYNYSLNNYDVQFTFTDYNDVKDIIIPINVTGSSSTTTSDKTAAAAENGTYQISNENHTVIITPTIEVQTANSSSDDSLYLAGLDWSSYSYHLHKNMTEDHYLETYCDYSWREGDEAYTDVSNGEVQTIEANGMTVKYVLNAYTFDGDLHCKDYIAVTQLGDDVLEVEAQIEWFNDEEEPAFTEDDLKNMFENLEVN